MRRRVVGWITVAGLALAAHPAAAMDDIASKERVGVRFGYVQARDGLRDKYGNGWDATLYFTEAVHTHLLVDIRLGAIYMGDLHDKALDDLVTGQYGINSQMRFLYFSAGPLVSVPVGGAYTLYGTLGIGVYSVSMIFDSGIPGYDFSQQHLGVNGGAGVSWRFAGSWCFELNATAHYFPVKHEITDLYDAFTAGAHSPMLVGVSAGATLDLR